MKRSKFAAIHIAVLAALGACSDDSVEQRDASADETVTAPGDDAAVAPTNGQADAAPPSASDAGSPDDDTDTPRQPGAPTTFYQDVLPLFEDYCLDCHQSGGIGPFSLSDYDQAKAVGELVVAATRAREMPPYLLVEDGECGTFADSKYLSEEQLATLEAWVEGGLLEGEPRPAQLPELEQLEDATEIVTPLFEPAAGGGELDLHDEYRCFLMDYAAPELEFLTGYNVIPGNELIVHHVLGFVVDMTAESETAGLTNEELLVQMDADSPERAGWPCFGAAGEGIEVEAVPFAWAPGQGVLHYPNNSGILISPERRIVVQVHYNMASDESHGQTDQTTIQMRIEPLEAVANVGAFLLEDPLLDSLNSPEPVLLEPGLDSVEYTWERSFAQMGVPPELPFFDLYGISPHMHETGHRYRFEVKRQDDADFACAARVNEWDFHWQHMYFYERPWAQLTSADSIRVTCDFDTSQKTEPVLPGWGTRNEMCLATMFVSFPKIFLGL